MLPKTHNFSPIRFTIFWPFHLENLVECPSAWNGSLKVPQTVVIVLCVVDLIAKGTYFAAIFQNPFWKVLVLK